jgi:hypothetical protein
MMEFRIPKRWMMLVKNATACSDLMLFRGQTSIHLENLSMATSRCVKPSGAFCKGPTRSRPHTANDQVMGIVCRALSEGVSNEGPRCCVMTASPRVYFLQ